MFEENKLNPVLNVHHIVKWFLNLVITFLPICTLREVTILKSELAPKITVGCNNIQRRQGENLYCDSNIYILSKKNCSLLLCHRCILFSLKCLSSLLLLKGIFVTRVQPEGPASKLLQPGDKIIQVTKIYFFIIFLIFHFIRSFPSSNY